MFRLELMLTGAAELYPRRSLPDHPNPIGTLAKMAVSQFRSQRLRPSRSRHSLWPVGAGGRESGTIRTLGGASPQRRGMIRGERRTGTVDDVIKGTPLFSWIVAVGDELLSGHTADTNSAWLASRLSGTPYPCSRIVVIPDQIPLIVEELQAAVAGEAERVFCCGGLGPTPDDRTMAAVAEMLGVSLVGDPAVLARVRERVAQRFREGRAPSPEPNPGTLKMALIPKGAIVLRNPVGGAPPLAIPLPGGGAHRWLFVVPGVPAELQAVFQEEIAPIYLHGDGGRIYRELFFPGVAESTFFPVLTELEASYPQVSFGSYPQSDGVTIRVSAVEPEALDESFATLRRLAPAVPRD